MSASTLPAVIDPFTVSGDEVAGATANEVAINLGKCVKISRGRPLHHAPPNLRRIFRDYELSETAKENIRAAQEAFRRASS